MVNIFTSYYTTPDILRQSEIDRCLQLNILNKSIGRIHVVVEDLFIDNDHIHHEKIKLHFLGTRPTFKDMFDVMHKESDADSINILCNSDIYFNEDIIEVEKYNLSSRCLALSRWEVVGDKLYHHAQQDSQDAWVFRGSPGHMTLCRFYMGQPGADNRIAYLLNEAGYQMLNPSKSVKVYHLHESGHRTYDRLDKVEKPYYFISPTDDAMLIL